MPSLLDTLLICEGVQEPDGNTPEEKEAAFFTAWQTLIDNGMAWTLQGWFGRTAMHYIESGYCIRARDTPDMSEISESVGPL